MRTKGVEIIEAEACPDHIHMLVSILPYLSTVYGISRGKSSLMRFDRHANLKYKYGQRSFWCRSYFVDTEENNETTIKNYIRNQIEEDYVKDQISLKEYIDLLREARISMKKTATLAAVRDGNAVLNFQCPF